MEKEMLQSRTRREDRRPQPSEALKWNANALKDEDLQIETSYREEKRQVYQAVGKWRVLSERAR